MSVNFDNATTVFSAARKLIIEVPPGSPVAFPQGAVLSSYGQNNGSPTIVVCNRTDTSKGATPNGTWQGADSENGVIIINEVPAEIAEMALTIFDENGRGMTALEMALNYLDENGKGDQYTTDRKFVAEHLSPAGRMLDSCTGIVKRDKRDGVLLVQDENGTMWMKLSNGDVRHIEPDILIRTYVNGDGSSIDLTQVPRAKAAA